MSSDLIETGQLKRNNVAGKIHLWLYTYNQSLRTSKRVEQFPELLKKIIKNSPDKISKEDAEILEKLELPSSAIINLYYSSLFQLLPDTLDLYCKMIVNNSGLPLITSDHPVFTYNQFLEKRMPRYNGNGLLLKGTQVFLPISPRHMILFFDNAVYKVGQAKSDVCITTSSSDILSLNSLSALNSEQKIFFSRAEDHQPYSYYSAFREKHIKNTTSTEIPKTNLKLSFTKELDKVRNWKPEGLLSFYRNEAAGLRAI